MTKMACSNGPWTGYRVESLSNIVHIKVGGSGTGGACEMTGPSSPFKHLPTLTYAVRA